MDKDKVKRQVAKCVLISVCLLLSCLYTPKTHSIVQAGVYDNAYTFYNTYGIDAVFTPTSSADGNIYCAVNGKLATSSVTRYQTIGWKISVRNQYGTLLQVIYCQLGGSRMRVADTQFKSGYEYVLYCMSLNQLRSDFNQASRDAYNSGQASIILDACNVVLRHGEEQGGMTDNGPSWGTVYTDYDGIVNAADWTTTTKLLLREYYNKPIRNLFYSVSLAASTGISSVSGGGSYGYGSLVTITATPKSGYDFSYWTGSSYLTSKSYSFYISGNVSWTAYGKKQEVKVKYYRNAYGGDGTNTSVTYSYGTSGQRFLGNAWNYEGKYLVGWNENAAASKANYGLNQELTGDFVKSKTPSVNLYGIWKYNTYQISFSGNATGVTGNMNPIITSFQQTVQIPENGFSRGNDYSFLGWGLSPSAVTPVYTTGSLINVAELARSFGIQNTNNGTITLYAVWDMAPSIEAYHLYFSKDDLNKGKLTEAYLSNYGKAKDLEDGEIAYGNHGGNAFLIENFSTINWNTLKENGQVDIIWKATDRAGNVTRKGIKVTVVDTKTKTGREALGQIRFISKDYFEDENGNAISPSLGGLKEDSCWLTNAAYRNYLRSVLK